MAPSGGCDLISIRGASMHRTLRAAVAAIIACAFEFAPGAGVQAAELRVLAVGALPDVFKLLVPQFEQATGHKLIVQFGATPGLAKQIEADEAFDVAVLVSGPMNEQAKQGFFAPGPRPVVSSVGLGAAVRKG